MKSVIFWLLENSERKHFAPRFVNSLIVGLIVLNSFAVALATVESYKVIYGDIFDIFETFSVVIFTLEYILRLWVCTEKEEKIYKHPMTGRLRYILTPFAIIDLVAILPYYLGAFVEIDLRFMRAFRLI